MLAAFATTHISREDFVTALVTHQAQENFLVPPAGESAQPTGERPSNTSDGVRVAARLPYLFFHPPRFPGAPPLDRGDGPNSGPDSRELVGWMILLPGPNDGFSGSGRSAGSG